jgi:hypothetical protein
VCDETLNVQSPSTVAIDKGSAKIGKSSGTLRTCSLLIHDGTLCRNKIFIIASFQKRFSNQKAFSLSDTIGISYIECIITSNRGTFVWGLMNS